MNLLHFPVKKALFQFILMLFGTMSLYSISLGQIAMPPKMPIDSVTKLISYSEVIKADGIEEKELYNRCAYWAKTRYKLTDEAYKLATADAHKVVVSSAFPVTKMDKGLKVQAGVIKYTLTVAIKEGRYKYTLTKINVENPTYLGIENWIKNAQNIENPNRAVLINSLNQADLFFNAELKQLRLGMMKPVPIAGVEKEW